MEILTQIEALVEQTQRKNEHFPFCYCSYMAKLLNIELGLPIVNGIYAGNFDESYFKKREKRGLPVIQKVLASHNLSYDPKSNLFIDTTATQFSKEIDPILLLKPSQVTFYHRSNGASHLITKILVPREDYSDNRDPYNKIVCVPAPDSMRPEEFKLRQQMIPGKAYDNHTLRL